MIATQKHLFALTAADLMSQPLILIPEHMSLPGAAHLLSQAQVSGAPVVDEEGRCVGVLSSTDFLHWVESGKSPTSQDAQAPCMGAWQIMDPEALPDNEVRSHMTHNPVTVEPATTVGELARMMLNAHIHRVIVVNPQGQPVGIVSSTDLLAALAHADEVRRLKGPAWESDPAHQELCTS